MIIDLAHTFGMKVVAEGVENWEQVELLRGMGCDLAQGFCFSEPMPTEKIPALLLSGPTPGPG
jgi:EAL domain-containing protein (putative c-di-GMP-specific phosphodiesterase class I)